MSSCSCDKHVLIRHTKSGFVLDAAEKGVKIQKYVSSATQQWKLHCTDLGKFYIVNVGNGNVLDIENGVINGARLITWPQHDANNEKWYINADGTIQCPNNDLVATAVNLTAGSEVKAYSKNGTESQWFQLELV